MSGNLSFSELKKYHQGQSRFVRLFEKMQNRDFFDTLDGRQVIVDSIQFGKESPITVPGSINIDSLYDRTLYPSGTKITITTSTGEILPSGKLKKTKDFGGVFPLFRQSNTIAILEKAFLDNSEIKHLILECQSTKVHYDYDCTSLSVHKQGNNNHADAMISIDQLPIYLSLKYGNTSRDFQQYSGMTYFGEELEVQNFIGNVIKEISNAGLPTALTYPERVNYKCSIISNSLMLRTVYGLEYGNEYGPNNVHYMAQGDPLVSVINDTLTVSFPLLFKNGELPKNDYLPTLYSRYAGDRYKNDPTLKNVRFLIAPESYRSSPRILSSNVPDDSYLDAAKTFLNINSHVSIGTNVISIVPSQFKEPRHSSVLCGQHFLQIRRNSY